MDQHILYQKGLDTANNSIQRFLVQQGIAEECPLVGLDEVINEKEWSSES